MVMQFWNSTKEMCKTNLPNVITDLLNNGPIESMFAKHDETMMSEPYSITMRP